MSGGLRPYVYLFSSNLLPKYRDCVPLFIFPIFFATKIQGLCPLFSCLNEPSYKIPEIMNLRINREIFFTNKERSSDSMVEICAV